MSDPDLGGVLSAVTAYGNERETVGRAEAQQQAQVELDALRAEFDAYRAAHPDPTPAKTWLLGMSTEASEWDNRAAEVNHPVNVRRMFVPSWSVSKAIALTQKAHASGCLPYVSVKMAPHSWVQVARGALDTDAAALARQLVALGYPVRVTFHHEPRDDVIKTPAQLVDWGRALTRLFTQMRAAVTADQAKLLILGPTDNGFPWGTRWGGLTDAQLGTYYTDELLAACDVMGADFYDGATSKNPGEPAWIKMQEFAAYFDRRGFVGVNNPGWKYDVGEWNFVDPEDCDDTWTFLTSEAGRDFNCVSVFNSGANNRGDLPASLGGSWVLTGDRQTAFRRMLDNAQVTPVTPTK